MSWHCSQALGADFSLAAYLDGLRSARSRLTTTAAHDSCSDRTKATSTPSRSGMTSELSTLDRGGDLSMSSQADSPAKTSVQRVAVQDLPESVRAFGSSLSASLASVGLALCSRKTVRTCVPVDLAASSKDLSAWGMTFGGACWELGTSARPIDGIGCGLLPTPSGTNGGRNHTCGRIDEWGGSSNPFRGTEIGKWRCLSFEEWMMGWPIGWSAPIAYETGRFRSWLQQHGSC